ncbi:hypothetical protein ASPFODRAFT_52511 [Aspergillus luchuensis CBS 106.47]|uniref:Uncharacterized protein n=1 Tax=Aspergillus luchuensis (strain CBS 106.47) TaxID=1137211 RepID=A0A1M3T263_ASPLC|nr:hypothetical protein ASPFODRAFT_52511 [Aspergillus luchuensis CBS 106.47]
MDPVYLACTLRNTFVTQVCLTYLVTDPVCSVNPCSTSYTKPLATLSSAWLPGCWCFK